MGLFSLAISTISTLNFKKLQIRRLHCGGPAVEHRHCEEGEKERAVKFNILQPVKSLLLSPQKYRDLLQAECRKYTVERFPSERVSYNTFLKFQ